ncbi:Uncharacterized protein PCOAH_00037390 [Plasmodium coatneyi]|uniref:Uncharacterized protein n=1 Tax=Plasmodium coatneyi TaxID=208452 RepID=A0A1B1E3B7_9APIC|nr:Uncharacterized protein PCOAH_00037390 [Plasmodium coatneyi]ANQ09485.1 Uncharacterized protein PCOAH_00037390 [Plasmodium coatneyi]
MEDNHEELGECLPTEHEHTQTGRKDLLNIKKITFILFIKISIYALFICSLYDSNHGTFSKTRNTHCNQGNKPHVKPRALIEQGPVYFNKYSKINGYSKLFHVHDDYPTFNEGTYLGRNLAALKSEGDERTSLPFHNLISKIENGIKYFLNENHCPSEEGIEDHDTYTNIPNVLTEDHDPEIEDPDEETVDFDADIDEQEELDEEEQRLKNYLDSYLIDEVHLKNIHDFIQETEDYARKYKKKKYDFFQHITDLWKRFNRFIKSIKRRLHKLMIYSKHHHIKLLLSAIIRLLSILFP